MFMLIQNTIISIYSLHKRVALVNECPALVIPIACSMVSIGNLRITHGRCNSLGTIYRPLYHTAIPSLLNL